MKTIEQKAKAYDEALKRAKYYQKENGSAVISAIFPELKESEDEKIRKGLIKGFNECIEDAAKNYSPNMIKYWHGIEVDSILAWLEKQGEKLPVGFYYVNSEGKKFYSDTFKYGNVTLHVENQSKKDKLIQEPLEKSLTMNNKDDERLRKTTISFLQEFAAKGYENAVECIDWLENQKVQSDSNIKDYNSIDPYFGKPIDFKEEH